MSDALKIENETLFPIKEAAKQVAYSKDYITRLAREQKIKATLVGRQWFVDLDSLRSYAEVSQIEQSVRKQQLSAQRKQESELRKKIAQQTDAEKSRVTAAPARAVALASLMLLAGVALGVGLHTAQVGGGSTLVHSNP